MLTIKRTNTDNPGYGQLIPLLDAELRIRDGDEHAFYAQYNKSDSIGHVVVAEVDSIPVGCGAFKHWEGKTVEIKRMFVLPTHRGQGIAARVLAALETWAAEEGYTACVLETGKKQPEAIALYLKSGYQIIPNYGQYIGMDNSICMQKVLIAAPENTSN